MGSIFWIAHHISITCPQDFHYVCSRNNEPLEKHWKIILTTNWEHIGPPTTRQVNPPHNAKDVPMACVPAKVTNGLPWQPWKKRGWRTWSLYATIHGIQGLLNQSHILNGKLRTKGDIIEMIQSDIVVETWGNVKNAKTLSICNPRRFKKIYNNSETTEILHRNEVAGIYDIFAIKNRLQTVFESYNRPLVTWMFFQVRNRRCSFVEVSELLVSCNRLVDGRWLSIAVSGSHNR